MSKSSQTSNDKALYVQDHFKGEDDLTTVDLIKSIRLDLLDMFPDAVRGSVVKSRWGWRGRKHLHLAYFIGADCVGGYVIVGKGNLLYFHEWDTSGPTCARFAESDPVKFVNRVRSEIRPAKIDRIVGERIPDYVE
jgi:hypothetical protein